MRGRHVGRVARGGRTLPVCWALACGAVSSAACDSASRATSPVASTPSTAPEEHTLVLLGDTQRTLLLERLIGREQNEAARQELIAKLAREEKPALLVHLGDMVNAGASRGEWEYFDRLIAPLPVPLHPVLGNHEYWGPDVLALHYLRERFPELAPRTYRTLRQGALGLVLADSNLRGEVGAEQARWFEDTLQGFEREPSVRAVLVFTHHPPFTNARYREDDAWVSAYLLPSFLRSRKTLLWASGHVHGYERFEQSGKVFIVSGGGGGPRVEYRVGAAAPHRAAYAPTDPARRAFHYVVIAEKGPALQVTVKCIPLDAVCHDGVLEKFVVPFGG